MKYCACILLGLMLSLGMAYGQKSKIKDDAQTTNPDSVKADGIGKAAIRGAQLMQASRDSLHAADLQPPSDIVDTFGVKKIKLNRKSYLRRIDIEAADQRFASAKALAEEASVKLALAKTDPKVTAQQVADANARLQKMQEYLKDMETKLVAIKSDWEEMTGMSLEADKDAGEEELPKEATKPSSKGAIKESKGK